MVPLGEVLKKSEEWTDLKPEETYREVTVKLWGKGVVQRREVTGAGIAASRRLLVRRQQFILSRIDARNGAFGLIPDSLDKAVVSNDFPVFNLNTQRIEPKFLEWMSKTHNFVELCKAASEGTTNRVRLKEERFLSSQIPLPPLPEQKRIVVRIEELAAKIEEAKGLRQKAVEEAEALNKTIQSTCMSDAKERYGGEALGNLISMSSGEGLVSSQLSNSFEYPVYGGGGFVGYYSRYLFEEPKIAIGRVGARCGCVFVTEPKAWITDNALYLTKISGRLDERYLVYALSNADLRQEANQAAQPVVSQKKINPIVISLPPLPEQRRIVAYLDDLQAKVDSLKRLQAQTSSELNAMLPSVLDRAFKGEL